MQGKSFANCFHNKDCESKKFAFTQVGDGRSLSIITEQYHLINNFKSNQIELYNINQDCKESKNIFRENFNISEEYIEAMRLFKKNNEKIYKIICSKWSKGNKQLSPEEIEELKALGYI